MLTLPSLLQGLERYVNNLDDRVDGKCLYMKFSKFGTITKAKVNYN